VSPSTMRWSRGLPWPVRKATGGAAAMLLGAGAKDGGAAGFELGSAGVRLGSGAGGVAGPEFNGESSGAGCFGC